ncbi:carboxylesterase family protein [Nonomuraea sp. KC401]|uniref:carboxylesterase/lipase family protein n=1 Tax=unclassified Nonomuraea TaxID=2593643 RepID=UPI0010FE743C|nr:MULTISPECIES: carboxylesterase family protein [unclassified Nonomuraea]NBE95549.1 carboxylesterase family protein [Nonomuraea sp. K271]TLF70822.1 carboxylesterase family protein [Nonomuraea sp. KC401]
MDMRRRNTVVAGAVALLLAQGCATPQGGATPARGAGAGGPDAVLDSGRIRGVHDGDVVRYRGIPYAQPPTGDLRWRPPRPVARWQGVRDATTSGPACPQASENPKESSEMENCLTLDVTVPRKPAPSAPVPGEPGSRKAGSGKTGSGQPGSGQAGSGASGGAGRPVMVWLHGGGFTAGRGADYDPRRLAVQGDVVVVTVEFRLGVLGYVALPGMPGGGTFGLQDQQAALRWVRRNAAAFGGDPGNVTLFGESGGGIATCGQLTAPGGKGLFHRAIVQSGSCGTALLPNATGPGTPKLSFWRPLKETYAATRSAARQVGCPAGKDAAKTLRCLRGKPVKELLELTGMFTAASYGGPALPLSPERALRKGDFARVPVLTGHTSKEALVFAGVMSLLGEPVTDENLPELLRQGFGRRAEEIARRYPRDDYATPSEAWAAPNTDAMFACPHARDGDALARRTKVYAYVFGDDTAPPFVPTLPGFPAGAQHASELAYLFDVRDKPINLDGEPVPLTRTQLSVARDMVAAWASFARTGTPSSGDRAWPRWGSGGRVAHLITERPGSTATTPAPRCAHFDRP